MPAPTTATWGLSALACMVQRSQMAENWGEPGARRLRPRSMQTTGRRALGGIALAAALLLSGCGGGSGSTAERAADEAASKAQPGGPGGAAAAPDAAGQQSKDLGGRDAKPASLPRIAPEDRAIVYTADLRVRARDVHAAASRAEQIVSAAGGYVHREDTATDPDTRGGATAMLTFKVPTDEYRQVLGDLGSRLGTRLHVEQQAEDVTEQVADVDSRVRSAQASLDRMRQLLAEANTIGEVLSVEQEIATREAELESLQARQRALADQTQYATVTLELVGPAAPRKEPRDTGFLVGLAGGWKAFAGTVGWLLTALGALLPFLVAFGILGYAGWRARALIRRRRTAPPTA
ncbi:MAG: DUF4349 domain-containing protein [Streptosporangiales bacterium]|nr:DUF4349 domain-containing protein [Streptosporangiales bacterium]